jgi:xylan 1,4-beta-xylosidase
MVKLASLLVLVNESLLFLAGICVNYPSHMAGCYPKRAGWLIFLLAALLPPAKTFAQINTERSAAQIRVDWNVHRRPFQPVWSYFGYDEPNFTYMKDGKKLLSELADLSPVPVYVRCHNLLTSGDGTPALKWGSTNVYTEDGHGRPVYDWRIVDSIFDTYIKRGMKPFAEIGFMPEALSRHPKPYRHHWSPGIRYDSVFTGWAYPPVDYSKWGELVFKWVRHCVERYGTKEVESWRWEVWNEPDIGYWQGTADEYFKLYDYAADAVKRALPEAQVGGPASTGPGNTKARSWLRGFLVHCLEGQNAVTGKKGAPLDFISFHAKGSPRIVAGRVQMNMAPQLRDVAAGFEEVRMSSFKDLPIYITECDPEGCAACGMATSPENAYRNGTLYPAYTAASFARIYFLAEVYGVRLDGIMSWSFEFEDQKWFNGFRDLATNGIDKPVLNVFRMFGRMKGYQLGLENDSVIQLDSVLKNSVHGQRSDIHALAVGSGGKASVMVWNYYDREGSADTAKVRLTLTNIPGKRVRVRQYLIDETHSNSYEAWKKMGSPQSVTEEQFEILEKAGRLTEGGPTQTFAVTEEGGLTLSVALSRQSVCLLEFDAE